MNLTFLGATETVTGSKYLLQDEETQVMIDCGLFQGHKALRLRNWADLPVDPKKIGAVILTHAHLDHSGYIPRLVKAGFNGPIYCSKATFEMCKILLPDSGHIQEEDAFRANHYSYTKHSPALPLYTEKEARDTFGLFRPVAFGEAHQLSDELSFTLHRAGHILGASFIRISDSNGTSILFSGDIGRPDDPVVKPPAKIQDADYIVVESTYGDRLHGEADPAEELAQLINQTIGRGGTVVIPAFAVGRTQEMLFYLHKLKAEGRIPYSLPIFLDSPMAINTSDLLCRFPNDHRLSEGECRAVCDVATYTRTVDQSKAIYEKNSAVPKVIVSASGMATGGRVLHHLKHYLGDARNLILLVGFQAGGTRGDRLDKGEKEIKIHGEMWPVRAQVEKLNNLSAHADYAEILSWMESFSTPPRKVFVVHGEAEAAAAMRDKIEEKFAWEVSVPTYLSSVEL